jgi:hypothetical protein
VLDSWRQKENMDWRHVGGVNEDRSTISLNGCCGTCLRTHLVVKQQPPGRLQGLIHPRPLLWCLRVGQRLGTSALQD